MEKEIESGGRLWLSESRHGRSISATKILENIFVDCNPIMELYYTVDGEIFISTEIDRLDRLLTFEEFEKKYGMAAEEHLRKVAQMKIDNLLRIVRLLDANPKSYSVQFSSDNAVDPMRNIVAYSREQIELYARRIRKSVLIVEAE